MRVSLVLAGIVILAGCSGGPAGEPTNTGVVIEDVYTDSPTTAPAPDDNNGTETGSRQSTPPDSPTAETDPEDEGEATDDEEREHDGDDREREPDEADENEQEAEENRVDEDEKEREDGDEEDDADGLGSIVGELLGTDESGDEDDE